MARPLTIPNLARRHCLRVDLSTVFSEPQSLFETFEQELSHAVGRIEARFRIPMTSRLLIGAGEFRTGEQVQRAARRVLGRAY